MAIFTYTAKDMDGEDYRGWLEAESEEELISTLHRQGKIILSVSREEKEPSRKRGIIDTLAGRLVESKVKSEEIALFAAQLSAMVDAGVPLLRALTVLMMENENPTMKRILSDVSINVEEGKSLSEALARYPVFSNLFLSMVKAGEMSGKLPETLKQLASYMETMEAIRRKVKAALTYPAFLVSFSVVIVAILLFWVVPTFEEVYGKFRAKLPAPTMALIQVSNFLKDHIFLLLPLAASIAVLLGLIIFKTQRGRYFKDRLMISLPIFGPIIYKSILVRFARTLGVLASSGIPFLDALRLMSVAMNNLVLSRALTDAGLLIERGVTIGEALEQTGEFPGMLVSMVSSGEEVGAVDKMLTKTADFYQQQVEAKVSGLMALLEPVLILVVGGIIAMVLVTMYLPVFTLGRAISGG